MVTVGGDDAWVEELEGQVEQLRQERDAAVRALARLRFAVSEVRKTHGKWEHVCDASERELGARDWDRKQGGEA